ncbi:MAG: zinc-dependent metalloprotease [Isosphaeraceae bacterium]
MLSRLFAASLTLALLIATPTLVAIAQDEPKKEEPKKEEPKKDEPKKEDPPKDEPKKEEPKKEEPKKDEPKRPEPRKDEGAAKKFERPTQAASGKAATKGNIKPFDEVIPNDAKTFKGLFWVHKVEDKYFFEIPTGELGKPMLWVSTIEKTQSGTSFAGGPIGRPRVVRWEQRNDDILLRDVQFTVRADAKDPISDAVAANSVEPIIEIFPIKAYGKDKAPVIEITALYTGDVNEFSARRALNASGVDPRKTNVESLKAFPENIEAKIWQTYRTQGGVAFGGGAPRRPTPAPTEIPTQAGEGRNVTVLVHHSMVKLPEEPMKPRIHDSRVGFFSVGFQDYADQRNHQVEQVQYITRWRLEKKDPNAEVSEPKKPIVYYLGREVPNKWRPWMKKGVEMWQPAFEKAGFKNAIIAKDAPTLREDPEWDAEDARYSSIRWIPNQTENAMGPHVHDPRTGEILEADIQVYHNILKLIRDWYFVQASPNDDRAQKLPLSDDLIGECLAYVIAHEVGHTLGFPHNMKASSSFTVAQLRDKEFTAKNGTEASIMDYGRFNYVAQPGDGATLIPKIGPYDFFAIEWGYKPFPKAASYEQEKAELNAIAKRQVKDPTLRFGDPNPGEDPSQQTEDLGSDPVAATELGLKNIDRVAGYLIKATSKEGEDYDLLSEMYSQLLGQRDRELGHVANVVGGFYRNNVYYGDGDKVYECIPAEQQKKAVAFLNEAAFKTPTALVTPDIVTRLQASGTADRILRSQRSLLTNLLGETRLKRMAEQATRDPATYQPNALIDDLSNGIFGELKDGSVGVDLYRRNLQRAFVEILDNAVKQDSPSASSDLPALSRGALRKILEGINTASGKEKDEMTKLHLADLKARIVDALDSKATSGANAGGRIAARPLDE